MKYNPGKEPSKPYQYRVAILPPDGTLPIDYYDYDDKIPDNLLDLYEEFLFCLPRYMTFKDGKEIYKNLHDKMTFKTFFVKKN